jgi:hypothetical protein
MDPIKEVQKGVASAKTAIKNVANKTVKAVKSAINNNKNNNATRKAKEKAKKNALVAKMKANVKSPNKPPLPIFETKNVAFFGTSCTAGSGSGICFRIGDSTVIG